MFSLATDASKIALVHLVARLRVGGYALLDTQFVTEHLARFGVIARTRAAYHSELKQALAVTGDFYSLADGLSAHLDFKRLRADFLFNSNSLVNCVF